MVFQLRDQIVRVVGHKVTAVALDDHTIHSLNPAFCHHRMQARQIFRVAVGKQHQAAVFCEVGCDFIDLFLRKVGSRTVEQQRRAVWRDVFLGQKVQLREADVFILETADQIRRQFVLAMTLPQLNFPKSEAFTCKDVTCYEKKL